MPPAQPGPVVAAYRWTGSGDEKITGQFRDADVVLRAWPRDRVVVDDSTEAPVTA
jgi:hypothetical protein